jgi:hypothetical protein
MKMLFKNPGLWWRFEGKYYHKDISNGIKNLIHWFPTIWKDRDYDQHYIYEVLLVKLEKQAKYILEKGIHVDANRDVERMLLCARLCRIQQEDLYHSEYMDYFKKEYEFVPTDETEKWFSMEDTLVWENYDEYLAKYPRQHKRVLSGEVNRFNKPIEQKDKQEIAMEVALENQNRSLKLLFKILDQQINRWWN